MQSFDRQNLESKLKEELIVIARDNDVPKYRKLSKPELVDSILQIQPTKSDGDGTTTSGEKGFYAKYLVPTNVVVGLLVGILGFAIWIGLIPDKLFSSQTDSETVALPLPLENFLDQLNVPVQENLTDLQQEDHFARHINKDDYIGKTVNWTGHVASIRESFHTSILRRYLMTVQHQQWNKKNEKRATIFAYLREKEEATLKLISPNQHVNFTGTIVSLSLGPTIFLKDTKILSVVQNSEAE